MSPPQTYFHVAQKNGDSHIRRTFALIVALALVACAPASSRPAASPDAAVKGSESAPQAKAVEVKGFAFKPEAIEVPVGTTVTWTNRDEVLHTVTTGMTKNTGTGTYDAAPDGQLDGRMDGAGKTFSFTFATAGSYAYFCDRHRHMLGSVVVR